YGDTYSLCCIAGRDNDELTECLPRKTQLSSCDSLLRNYFLRICAWLFGLAAVFMNSSIIKWRYDNLSRSKVNSVESRLLIILTIFDFINGVYILIIAGADAHFGNEFVLHGDNWRQSIVCTLIGIIETVASQSSLYIVTLMTIDRCLVIALPFRDIRLHKTSARYLVIFGVSLIIILATIPAFPITYFGTNYYGETDVCLPSYFHEERPSGWEYTTAFFILPNCVFVIVIMICYIVVFKTKHTSDQSLNAKDKTAFTMSVRILVIVFFVMGRWIPFICTNLVGITEITIPGNIYPYVIVLVLPITAVTNPMMYTYISGTYTLINISAIKSKIDEKQRITRIGKNIKDDFKRIINTSRICWSAVFVNNKAIAKDMMVRYKHWNVVTTADKNNITNDVETALISLCEAKLCVSDLVNENNIYIEEKYGHLLFRATILFDGIAKHKAINCEDDRNKIIHHVSEYVKMKTRVYVESKTGDIDDDVISD
uniref:G-protein coupled receptor GRL101-like n=1 Tax=Saccoglossus kowalevskii TaxID=10224 RepID=A0ABM0M0Z4_SACKO